MPDIEHKFSYLESSILTNCMDLDNAELQARLKDINVPNEGTSAPPSNHPLTEIFPTCPRQPLRQLL